MFASASLTSDAYLHHGMQVPFDTPGPASNAIIDSARGTILLGGSGTESIFRVAVGATSRYECKVEVLVNDVVQPTLSFGSGSYNGGQMGGEALITIRDNATIQLRAGFHSYGYCELGMSDYGEGNRAFLTVMKIN